MTDHNTNPPSDHTPGRGGWWLGLSMQEAIFAGLTALSIVLTRVVLDFHIKVPGHTMFLVTFLLFAGRGCIRRPHAGMVIAALVGLLSLLTGPGKSGPLIFFKFFLPGLTLDLGLLLFPRALQRAWSSGLLGAAASFSRFPVQLAVDLLLGMGTVVAVQHSLLKTASGTLFGLLGGLLAPVVINRLLRSGLLPR